MTAAGAQAQALKQVGVGFERDINQYRWTSDANVRLQSGPWALTATNQFLSEAFILSDQLSGFRDEEEARWQVERRFSESVSGVARGHTAWFSLSEVLVQDLYAGVRYQPRASIVVEPVVGVAWDRRPGAIRPDGSVPLRLDRGPAYGMQLEVSPPPIDEYRLTFRTNGTWQFITPRRGRLLQTLATATRTFNKTEVRLEAGYANFRRDAYQAASFLNRTEPVERLPETIESNVSDTVLARLEVERPLHRHWRLTASLDVGRNQRFIRTLRAPDDALFFDTDFNRRMVDGNIGVQYEGPSATGLLVVERGATVERRQLANRNTLPPSQATLKGDLLQQADFDRGTLGLRGQLQATPFRRLSVRAEGVSSIIRRDTPDQNFDDRDEILHTAQAGVLLRLSRYLEADVNVFGTYLHTVYLKAVRSAENNRQRSLRLRPSVRWQPSEYTRIRLTSEIRATYTVDDFEVEGRPRNDQSARERRYEGELDQRLASGWRLRVEGRLSDLHLGRLLWAQFAEIPFDTLRTYSGWLRIVAGDRWTAELGARAFVRRDYNRRTTVRYSSADGGSESTITRAGREWIEQFGPTIALEWPMSSGSALRLDGWVQIQRIRQRLFGDLPEGAAERIRVAARRGTRRLVPNLNIAVVWRF